MSAGAREIGGEKREQQVSGLESGGFSPLIDDKQDVWIEALEHSCASAENTCYQFSSVEILEVVYGSLRTRVRLLCSVK